MINNLIKAEIEAGRVDKMFQKGDDHMNNLSNRFSNMLTIMSVLFFLSGCAVFVRDGGYHHRGYWRRHSSLQQSNLPANHQMTALKGSETQDRNDEALMVLWNDAGISK